MLYRSSLPRTEKDILVQFAVALADIAASSCCFITEADRPRVLSLKHKSQVRALFKAQQKPVRSSIIEQNQLPRPSTQNSTLRDQDFDDKCVGFSSVNFRKQICSICVSKMASHWSFLWIHRFQSHHVAPPCTKSQANLQLSMAALASSKKTFSGLRKLTVAKISKKHGSITEAHTDHTWKDQAGKKQLCALAARHRTGIEGRVDGWKWNSVAKNLLAENIEAFLLFDLVCGKVWNTFYRIMQAAVIWLARLKGFATHNVTVKVPSQTHRPPAVPSDHGSAQ